MKKTVFVAGLAALLLTLSGTSVVQAQGRWVVVNGALQSPMDLALLDRYACTVIPNGSYWLNYNTGIWGYANDPRPMGYISARVRSIQRLRPAQPLRARNAVQHPALG